MSKAQNFSMILFAIIASCLITMGASCPGCNMKKNCSANNNKLELCKNDKHCYYNHATNICHQRPEGHLAGCYDIDDEIPCKESKDCSYDSVAKVCLEAEAKGQCANIQVAEACDADSNCMWDAAAEPAQCKERAARKVED